MKLKIIKLHPAMGNNCDLICEDIYGKSHTVDLFRDGSLPEGTKPEDLIGKTVEVGFLSPYIEIANDGVKILD
jgi:hypothetical protein